MRFSTISANSLPILLVSLASIATASGQTATSKLNPNEPLEKYNMPPAYIYRLETSPRMISPYGAFISYQVNVDAQGNNIVGDAANEPSIAVDPTDGNKMTIGWRQFNSVQSDFRQGGWGFTTDAGVTWTFPGILENNVFRSDPVLDSNDTGNFFYLSLRETFYDDIWRSTSGGSSWTRLTFGDVSGGDKQWFTIDRTNGTGHGFQYQALEHLWQQLGRQAVQSLHRRRGHMDESDLYSELACLGNTGCGFKRQSFYRRRGQLFQPVLVHSLQQCAEPGRHANF